MRSATRPILSAIKGRLYSARAAAQSAEHAHLPKQAPKISRLPNGAVVASVENYAPVARIGVLYNAGSRYEEGSNEGITHCLRIAADQSTEKQTGFAVARNVQQIGGSISCSTSREHMIYMLDCIRDNLGTGMEFLGQVATAPAFKQWEVAGLKDRLHLDLAMLEVNPEAQLMEAVHLAAFRSTLGNSLYMPAHKIGTHSPEKLSEFVSSRYTGSNMAVVGVGVDHDQLVQYAQQHIANSTMSVGGASSSQAAGKKAARYYGGATEFVHNSNSIVHAAIVSEGQSLGSKDLMALAVLQRVMGTGPYVKYSSNLACSRVSQAAAQGTANPFAASCINVSYSDSGLFGFCVAGNSNDMGKILKSVVSQFAAVTKGGITDQEVNRAKAQLKASIAMDQENSANTVVEMGAEALVSGGLYTPEEINQAVDKITTTDVLNVAKKVVNNKPSMAAVGDLSNTPYLDDLM